MKRLFNSLAFRIVIIIILAEVIVLAVVGYVLVDRFAKRVDQRVETQLRIPSTLIQAGLLNLDVVTNRETMTQLVGAELIEGMVIDANYEVLLSLNPEHLGQNIADISGLEPSLFDVDDGQNRIIREGNPIVSVSSIRLPDQPASRFFVYLEVNPAMAEAQKAELRYVFLVGSVITIILTSAVFIVFFNYTTFSRITGILKVLKQVEIGNLSVRVEEPIWQDEIGRLQRRVNATVNQLERTINAFEQRLHDLWQTQLSLKRSEERFRQLAENIQQVFWISSPGKERMLYVSPAYETVWQQSRQDLYKHPNSFLEAIHPEDRERVLAGLDKQMQGGYDEEYRIVRSDGTVRWVRARAFPIKNKSGDVYRIAGIIDDITERKQMEEQIKASLQEKEVLLKEIHHRVKNNMQVISSLLDLQAEQISDTHTRDLFKESQNRIKSMALIHERLYQSRDLARIDFAVYVESLIGYILRSYGVKAGNIGLQVCIPAVSLNIETAIPCGLIINELVSNAFKYAFPEDRAGNIWIDLHSTGDQRVSLLVKDDGVGFPPKIDFRRTTSLGLTLVNTLVKQLNGTIELSRDGGTTFEITFSEPATQKKIPTSQSFAVNGGDNENP